MEDLKSALLRITNELIVIANKIEESNFPSEIHVNNKEIAKRVISRILKEYPDYQSDEVFTYKEYFSSESRKIYDEPTWTTLYATMNKILTRLGYERTYRFRTLLIPYSILKVWDEEYFSENQSRYSAK